jgi:hypothetical protein
MRWPLLLSLLLPPLPVPLLLLPLPLLLLLLQCKSVFALWTDGLVTRRQTRSLGGPQLSNGCVGGHSAK